jgi:Ni/Fe-hydrogenase subunit HybB-like protein
MSAPDYAGPQHAPLLTIAVLIAGYALLVVSVWWGRHRRDDHDAAERAKHRQLMKELSQYDTDEKGGIWDEAD